MRVFSSRRAKLRRALLGGALALTCSACVSIYRDHGYVPNDEDLAAIQIGVDTRESVAETVGIPGASGVLNDSGYYYISTRIRQYGATEPKPVARELVAINFDPAGRVRGIERFGLEDGRVIELQRRVTDNGEADKTFIRQLLGNLGRIGPGTLLNDQ